MEKLKEEVVEVIKCLAEADAHLTEAYKDIPDPPDIHDQTMADLLSGTGDIIEEEMGKLANSIGVKLDEITANTQKVVEKPEVSQEDKKPEINEIPEETKVPDIDTLTAVKGIGKIYAKQLLDEYKDFATIKATSSKAIAKKIEGINEKLADELKEAI